MVTEGEPLIRMDLETVRHVYVETAKALLENKNFRGEKIIRC
jgi:hypothetical protein